MSRRAEQIVERHVLDVGQHRPEGSAELGLRAGRKRAVTLAVKALGRRDDRLFGRIVRAREFERALDRLGAAVAEETVVEARGREHRQRFGEHRAQRIEQVLAVQRLAAQLIHHRLDDFGIAMADVEDAETAQTIDVLRPATSR